MRANLRPVPNQLTALRLTLVPVLWGLAVLDRPRPVAAGLLLAGLTDAVDGSLARRLGQPSAFGSAFDPVADTLIVRSGIVWLVPLKPALISDHPVVLIAWFGLDTAAFTRLTIRPVRCRGMERGGERQSPPSPDTEPRRNARAPRSRYPCRRPTTGTPAAARREGRRGLQS